ncbi:MAG: PEP-CTERM sorting domain-containing protein [Gemmataceae bacterium]|nr:PEP-CTERM sorting domain-containing protein [Gemmataceae bacterium]
MSARLILPVCAALAAAMFPTLAHAAPIYSNSPAGDFYNFTGSTTTYVPVGSSGWYYYGQGGSTVGINYTYPHNGNGSVFLNGTSGSSQGGILYTTGSALGSLSQLQSVSYDWYRDSSSTNPNVQAPALGIRIDADGNLATTVDQGSLIFERVYNTPGPVPTDTWVSENITSSTYLWNTRIGSLPFASNINSTDYVYDASLSEWQAHFPNAVVIGFFGFFGSGWNGQFSGAVDNITWQFQNQPPVSFNFEVQVPEPASLASLAVGLVGLGAYLRRRRAA